MTTEPVENQKNCHIEGCDGVRVKKASGSAYPAGVSFERCTGMCGFKRALGQRTPRVPPAEQYAE